VRTSKKPKHEVIAAGPIGKSLVAQHRKTPVPVEAQMALQTDKTHLSRKNKAQPTTGTLYSPAPTADATATGGWKWSGRTGGRSFLGSVSAAAVGVAVARWVSSRTTDAPATKRRGKAQAGRALRR